MALTYHGRLNKKTIARPSSAFQFGEEYFSESSPHRTVDIRLAWETVDGLTKCATHLPEDYDAFWVDIAAHVDVDSYALLDQWMREFSSGHISLICLKDGYETEVRFKMPTPGPERYDDARYPPGTGAATGTVSVRTAPLASRRDASKDVLTSGAHRVENAFQILREDSRSPAPEYPQWLETQFESDSPVHKWTDGPTLNREALYQPSETTRVLRME